MQLPLITVIIPTYNYAHYIGYAIDSVLNQDYPADKIEIIVVDDGSTDNTKEVLQKYISAGTVRFYYQQNKGKANATDKAIKYSNGKYIFNLDADDWYFPGKISSSVNVFEASADVVHVSSPAKYVYADSDHTWTEDIPLEIVGKNIDGNELLLYFYKKNILFGGGSTYAARAETLKSIIIPANVDMYIDEFLIMSLLPFGKSYFFKEPLSAWRVHGANYSGKAASDDAKVVKGKRLLASADGMLEYIQKNGFNKQIVTIYKLRNLTRHLAFKEGQNSKSLIDIIRYASFVFKARPGWEVIKSYNVINRLMPAGVLKTFKSVLKTKK